MRAATMLLQSLLSRRNLLSYLPPQLAQLFAEMPYSAAYKRDMR